MCDWHELESKAGSWQCKVAQSRGRGTMPPRTSVQVMMSGASRNRSQATCEWGTFDTVPEHERWQRRRQRGGGTVAAVAAARQRHVDAPAHASTNLASAAAPADKLRSPGRRRWRK